MTNDNEPLFAEVARELNRHERLERYCSLMALAVGFGLLFVAAHWWGGGAALLVLLAFVMGVIAQRIR